MGSLKNIKREYGMDDLLMLQLAQVFHNNFLIDKTAFTSMFPHLDIPFETNFQTAIDDADDIPSSAEIEAEIKVITEELNSKMPEARAALQKLFTYADIAFSSKAKTNSFGKNRYEQSRNSQLRMKELLELAHRQAEETTNNAALIAAGYTQSASDMLATLMNEIDTLNSQQEDALSERGTKTEQRIKAYNSVYDYMKQINQASKVVFVNSPAKLDMYLLYPTSQNMLPKVQSLSVIVQSGPPLMAELSWDAVSGALEYDVEKSEVPVSQPPNNWIIVDTVPNTVAQSPVNAGIRTWFRVRARNAGKVGPYSNPVSVQP